MKQCRFCDNMIPFYGRDTCDECIKEMQERVLREEKERLENNKK